MPAAISSVFFRSSEGIEMDTFENLGKSLPPSFFPKFLSEGFH